MFSQLETKQIKMCKGERDSNVSRRHEISLVSFIVGEDLPNSRRLYIFITDEDVGLDKFVNGVRSTARYVHGNLPETKLAADQRETWTY